MMLKKEHLLHYLMKGHIHLSKKDYGFFNNLTYIIKEKNQVTSNQNKLFDKLVIKYQRQLRKCGHNIEQLQQLNWAVKIIDSSEEYLIPKLYLKGDQLCLRTPFNTKFVQTFKAADDNTFAWNKEDRIYSSPFYTHALRLAIDMCSKYFSRLEMDDAIKAIINPLDDVVNYTKAPILTVDQGKYYISNMNKNLAEAVKDIDLSDDPKTLYLLSRYGIEVHEDIIKDDPLKSFASNYMLQVDIDQLLGPVLDYLKILDINDVYMPTRRTGTMEGVIKTLLSNKNIKVHSLLDDIPDGTVIMRWALGNDRGSGLALDHRKVSKMINIVNSRPIEIK